jgi:hypothetical protein
MATAGLTRRRPSEAERSHRRRPAKRRFHAAGNRSGVDRSDGRGGPHPSSAISPVSNGSNAGTRRLRSPIACPWDYWSSSPILSPLILSGDSLRIWMPLCQSKNIEHILTRRTLVRILKPELLQKGVVEPGARGRCGSTPCRLHFLVASVDGFGARQRVAPNQ